jgi:hypothetical protein
MRSKINLTLICCLFFFNLTILAASINDSVPVYLKVSNNMKPAFVINADFRETLVKGSTIKIYGFFGGIRYKNKNLYTLGYYTLTNSSKQKFKIQNQGQPIPVNDDVSLWFLSAGYSRTLYNGKLFKVDIPLEIGYGEGSNGMYDTGGELLKLLNSKIIPIQAGVSTNVKLTRWFGIHLQAGYRQLLGKSFFQNQYSGLYYSYGLSLNFGTILKDLKH